MSIDPLIPLLEETTGRTLNDCRLSPLGGGDINSAYHLQSTEVSWFIKVNRPTLAFMFEAEAQGLNELAKLKSIRVPTVITYGQSEQYSFLVLEHIELGGLRSDSAALLGEQLAALHKHRQAFSAGIATTRSAAPLSITNAIKTGWNSGVRSAY
nr:fructosamine kinase family protein [Methylomarinum sp. Ch1-1]MDP4519637.1 fructosamine kinase family protein [Methylomarinum sp. Ch1-1]